MFKNLFHFEIIALVLIITQVSGFRISTRIIGGSTAPSLYGLFLTSLQNLTGSHVCGGAVISEKHILTAAHCVYGANPEYIRAVVGTANLDSGGKEYSIDSISLYQDFNFSQRTNDIAILKVNETFDFSYAKILKLQENPLSEGDPVTIVGYGAQEQNGESSRELLVLNQTVFNQETCHFAMRYFLEVSDNMFCTFTQIGEGTCHGDSGSPLINSNYEIVGVASWGVPCAAGFPDVHTRINPYISWIREEIKK